MANIKTRVPMATTANLIPNHSASAITRANIRRKSLITSYLNKFVDVVPCFLDVSNAPFDITPCKIFDSVTT